MGIGRYFIRSHPVHNDVQVTECIWVIKNLFSDLISGNQHTLGTPKNC